MGSAENNTATTFRNHPDFPFVRVGASIDFLAEHGAPDDDLLLIDEWWIEINGKLQTVTYRNPQDAIDAVPTVLFGPANTQLVQQLIRQCLAEGNDDLAIRLAYDSGKAAGRTQACNDLTRMFTSRAAEYAMRPAA